MTNRKLIQTRHEGIYQRGKSYWWIVDVGRRGGKRQRATGTAHTLKEAMAARAQARVDASTDSYVPPSRVTLAEFVEKTWLPSLEASELKANTVSYYRSRMARVAAALGDYRMSELNTPAPFDRLWQQLAAQGLSKGSLVGTRTTARKAFDFARRKGLIARNPVLDSDIPKVERREKPGWWSSAELGAFLEATTGDRLAAMWATFATTGARRGEVLALRWEDLDGPRLAIRRNRVITDGNVYEGEPKSASGTRTIGLDPQTVKALQRHRVAQMEEKMANRSCFDDGGYLFCDEIGRPYDPPYISRLFATTVRRAGLRVLRLHDVRHSYLSSCVEQGMGIKRVSERAGHSRVETTLNLYVHTSAESDQDLADQMGKLLWGSG